MSRAAEHETASPQLVILPLRRANAFDLLKLEADGVEPIASRRLLLSQPFELGGRLTPARKTPCSLIEQALMGAEIVHQPTLNLSVRETMLLVLTVNREQIRSDPL